MSPVTAVISVYNEEYTIYKVVKIVAHLILIEKVIIANDGFTDKTRLILQYFEDYHQINSVNLKRNHIKT